MFVTTHQYHHKTQQYGSAECVIVHTGVRAWENVWVLAVALLKPGIVAALHQWIYSLLSEVSSMHPSTWSLKKKAAF